IYSHMVTFWGNYEGISQRSAWWALLFLIPFIGWLIIIVFNCQAGTPGENRFGPDPKLEP
ncbi:DUF805 domain-containing protein, partial [Escherichia coli]|uniref:DUF805 domain-containing protein n=1 Tax=Escherichia coli TaxID=562 RepID=UPI0012FF954A